MKINWRDALRDGTNAVKRQNPGRALSLLETAYELAPLERDVRYWLGNAYRINGRIDDSTQIFEALLAENSADVEVAMAFAYLLREIGQPAKSSAVLLQTCENIEDTKALLSVCGFLRDSDDYQAAIRVLKKVRSLEPEQVDHALNLARLYQATGSFQLAEDQLRNALRKNPTIGFAWLSLAQQHVFERDDDEDFIRLKQVDQSQLDDESKMCMAFALAKASNDLGLWSDAWAEYEKGNSLASQRQVWEKSRWLLFLQRKLDTRNSPPASMDDARHPVFIVGNPRSGTTLVDTLLSKHPEIVSRGELNYLSEIAKHYPETKAVGRNVSGRLASEYWTQLRLDGPENYFYIDKNPLNFRYLDLLFQLFPGAKVIHVSRDGRDSCLSCFTQLFQHPDAAFTNSLDSLVDFYAGYRKLMNKWEIEFGKQIHTIEYEKLVESTSDVVKGMMEFLGADYHDQSNDLGDEVRPIRTASVWQARQAVHKSSLARWRAYYEFAPSFFDKIAQIDVEHRSGPRDLD